MSKHAAEKTSEKGNVVPMPGVSSVLSPEAARIRDLVNTTDGRELPAVADVIDLAGRPDPMAFPEETDLHPEFVYRWESTEPRALARAINRQGWCIVTRNNHPDFPDYHFDLAAGAILFGGQNILVYQRAEVKEAKQKMIEREFDVSYETAAAELDEKLKGTGARIEDVGNRSLPAQNGPPLHIDTVPPDFNAPAAE